jgi:tRNA(fMet)-specific endonuclease VapC
VTERIVRFLLDTNVISELLRDPPSRSVERRVAQHQAASALAAPTVDELQFGISRLASGRRRELLQSWLEKIVEDFPVLAFDREAALWLGRERARLAGIGRTAALYDGQIAAIAAVHDLTLVTRNTADYRPFAKLRTANWFAK